MPKRRSSGILESRSLVGTTVDQRVAERKAKPGGSSSPRGRLPEAPNPLRAAGAAYTGGHDAHSKERVLLGSAGSVSLPKLPRWGTSLPSSPSATPGPFHRTSPKSPPSAAEKLSLNLQKASAKGISQTRLLKAEQAIAEERETEALMGALKRGKLDELRAALSRAQKAGVNKTLIASATVQVRQLDVFDRMLAAMEAEDAFALADAIKTAKECDIDRKDIEAAENALVQVGARGRLRAAMELKKLDAINFAIDEAEAVGLDLMEDQVLLEAKELKKRTPRAPAPC